jgi:hypothetical protein
MRRSDDGVADNIGNLTEDNCFVVYYLNKVNRCSFCFILESIMERSIPWWLRAILWLAAAQALLLTLALFAPPYVNLLVPWPASPLNARFIASLYVSLGLGVLLCSMARSFREMRIVLFGVGMATVLLLFLTILRMYLHPGELKQFPTFWLLFYIVDPLLVAFAFWRFGWGDTSPRGASSLTPLWLVQAVFFGVLGLILLLLPIIARSFWPWAITEPQAQLYSAFFLTLAVASLLVIQERRWEGIRWLVFMIMMLSFLVLVVSLLHLPRFTNSVTTIIWFLWFGAEAIVFGGLFIRHLMRPSSKGALL